MTGILLADDHRMVRDGLRALIERQEDMKVVGEAGNGREAVRLALELKPDVVVMDIAMPDMNGLEATRRITASGEKPVVIAISVYTDRQTVLRTLDAGASGYVPKVSAFAELLRAIRAVVGGNVYVSPRVADTVLQYRLRTGMRAEGEGVDELTPREREFCNSLRKAPRASRSAGGCTSA
ncbi:MAG: response regulator transcription factor [Candidatus Brocadiia bacterium]